MSRLWSAAPLLLTLASLFWAGNFVLGRAVGAGAAGDLGPVALAFWRWVAAFALVLALGGRLAWRERREIARAWPFLLFAGLMSVSAYNTLIYVGLQSTPVLNALLLQSAIPVLILVAGFAIYRDRIGWMQVLGVALSLAGVIWILTEGHPARLLEIGLGRGDALVLLGVAGNAVYFATLRSGPRLHPMAFLVAIFGLGLALLAPVWWLSGHELPRQPVDALSIGYLAVFASLLALLFFNRGVALIGAARAGGFLHLMPVFGSLLSAVFLAEMPRTYHLIGGAVVIAGVLLAQGVLRRPGLRRAAAQKA
ncbi:hypothetical protein BYZ73_06240 [Rhodovulum viride]|uniref:EamA domain-containing protein n=1 Tax=Rhodovulum viride TaxID=1231134 RepID=A0ABX9DL95_9RHOB|nr:DMT family transporter [Rhodovulum viride]RAP42350.1 hypothetical protein BYZ73_06240 [Rhodovulum viride]